MTTSNVTIEALVPAVGITGLNPVTGDPAMEGLRSVVLGTSTRHPSSVTVSPGELAAHQGRLAGNLASMLGGATEYIRCTTADGQVMTAAELLAVGEMGAIVQLGKIGFDPHNRLEAVSGTWTESYDGGLNLWKNVRTAAATTEVAVLDFSSVALKDSTGAGRKPIGMQLIYALDTADANDVDVEVFKTSSPADGVAKAAVTLSTGQTYDAAHDTAGERGDSTAAPELHTMTITFDPALAAVDYLNDGETLHAELTIDAALTTAFTVWGWELLYEERLQ